MAEETSMAQVLLLMQQQMAAQQRMLERMAGAPPLAQQAATAAAAAPPETRPSTMRVDFEKFSGEPEDWNACSKKFGGELIAKGFERSQADPCVFRRKHLGKVVVIIVVYVDDPLVLSETKQDEHQTLEDLRSSFPIQDIGEVSYYLGCHITRDRKARTVRFDQQRYAQTVAERFEIWKTSVIPVSTGKAPLSKADGPQNDAEIAEMRGIPCREAVGH